VTQITNPNRVGTGFIDLGPQKRFASSTANVCLPPPKPLNDILNVEAKKPPPPPLPTNRMAPPGGKIVTSDKDAGLATRTDQQRALDRKVADAPVAVPVETVAAVAAQLADDEALARQLQHEPPEPVAALVEQVADAAKTVPPAAQPAKTVAPAPQPASQTAAPSEATTGDTTAKRVRALRKKLRDIELLEERQRAGVTVLQQDQLDKIGGKAAIVKELGALACDTIEKEHGATTGDDATAKRVRALRKKLRDIELLEERQREGTAVLEPNQMVKIGGKAAIVKELGALLA
jgi:hypothetical protein